MHSVYFPILHAFGYTIDERLTYLYRMHSKPDITATNLHMDNVVLQ